MTHSSLQILPSILSSPNPSFDTLHYFAFKAFQSFAADSFRISLFITLQQGLYLPHSVPPPLPFYDVAVFNISARLLYHKLIRESTICSATRDDCPRRSDVDR
jgi:hypothetical protein